jgi:hypothetical protein
MATLAVAAADGTIRASNAKAAVNLCTALTGNVDSTNIADRGGLTGGGAVVQEGVFWRFLKIVMSSNTSETLTADFYQSGT